MTHPTTHTTARVTVTVQVVLDQPWGAGVTADEVYRQARDEAVSRLLRVTATDRALHVIGDPMVEAVIVSMEKA